MDKRPQRTDNEDDILEMQRKFLEEKAKNNNFQPAAKVIKVDKGKKQSIFAKTRNIKESSSKEAKPFDMTNIVLGDVVEKFKPSSCGEEMKIVKEPTCGELGFPKAERIKLIENSEGKSLFALSMERKRHQMNHVEENEASPTKALKETFGEKSVIIEDDKTAESVHEENLELLSKMNVQAILEERDKLLKSMDPNLIKFLTGKRQQKKEQRNISQPKLETCRENVASTSSVKMDIEETPAAEILRKSEAERWIHFDKIEKEKFEWMKNVPLKSAQLKPGEKFEARFDWKGVLLPFTDENDFKKDNRELYLHGDEPYRPGYTLQELFRLAR